MNNEQQQIIDEAYEKYKLENKITNGTEVKVLSKYDDVDELVEETVTTYTINMSKEQFIDKCKTNSEFSETWGLKIEERELSDEERIDCMRSNKSKVILPTRDLNVEFSMDEFFRPYGVPTRLITITYNNETIESYE